MLTTAHRALLFATCFGLAICSGCGMFSRNTGGREQAIGPGKMTPTEIQSEVMSFSDSFNAAITQSWREVAAQGRAETAEAGFLSPEGERATVLRRAALEVNLSNANASLSIASSPNPFVALADMITLVTLQRMVLETAQAGEILGPEMQANLVSVYRTQEAQIWRVADRAMTPAQQQELRDMIDAWRAENPNVTYVANVRLEDFGSRRQQGKPIASSQTTSLLSLFALDPLAGLDPAQREVARSRMLAERVFFFASRSANIVKWNIELLYQNLLRAPEFVQLLESVKQASESTKTFSDVAATLPEVVRVQREQAIEQAFAFVKREREGLVAQVNEAVTSQRAAALQDLERAQSSMSGTMREFRETAASADKLAERLTHLVNAADVLTARFAPEPGAAPRDPNRQPMQEFTTAAERTGETVDRMTKLVERVENLLASPIATQGQGVMRTAVQELQLGSNQLVDRAFWRLIVLGLLIPFSCAAAYKWATRRGSTSPV